MLQVIILGCFQAFSWAVSGRHHLLKFSLDSFPEPTWTQFLKVMHKEHSQQSFNALQSWIPFQCHILHVVQNRTSNHFYCWHSWPTTLWWA